MRAIIFLAVLIIVCAACWMVASVLSPDAVAMAVGLLFGILGGIPTALLMAAGNRRNDPNDDYHGAAYPYQPTVTKLYPPTPQPSAPTRNGWPERISPEDEHLYSYELSAYAGTVDRVNGRIEARP